MRLNTLQIAGLRNLTSLQLELSPGINLFVGPNGAGKTSILEAAFLLSHGRSFRSNAREALIQRGQASLTVFCEVSHGERTSRVGMERSSRGWRARLDGEDVSLGSALSATAVTCFEPGSHALIAGGSDERRRFMDWGVFHVEQAYLVAWRRYQRALTQRNRLLRTAEISAALYEPWELELATAGTAMSQWRADYLARLKPCLEPLLDRLLPELGTPTLSYRRGWSEGTVDLAEALVQMRDRDRSRGHTQQGPHRADWSLAWTDAPTREHLSRGQEKLAALACILAQSVLYRDTCGDWPVLCLDDLASELDQAHRDAALSWLAGVDAQILLTGTAAPGQGVACGRRFHVEQGHVTPLL